MSHKQLVAKRNSQIVKMSESHTIAEIAATWGLSIRRTIRIIRKMRKASK